VQDLTVPHAVRPERPVQLEGTAVGAAQHPPAAGHALVGHAFTGPGQQPGEEFGHGRVIGQGHVDPPTRGGVKYRV